MTTRFAPSPTGLLHLGHAYAAAVAHNRGDRFLLRFEDIDHTRVRTEYYHAIEEDLKWLGLTYEDKPWRQSGRLKVYEATLEKLKDAGVLYPCYCTRREIEEELSAMTNAPHGPEGALYPGTCRDLKKELKGEPAWRLDSEKAAQICGELNFTDRLHGQVPVNPRLLGDLILGRKDIGTSYHLAVVVDDFSQEIDLVTRGEDLIAATHVHRVLQYLLGFPEPEYEHHKLILDDSGHRMAKRNDALSLRTLRENGIGPEQILAEFELI